jgi:hypothetical protein
VHCCQVSDGVIFLDLERERYFGVPHSQTAGLFPVEADARADSPDALLDEGLITSDSTLGRPSASVSLDIRSAIEFEGRIGEESRIGLRHIGRFLRSYIYSRTIFRLRSLRTVVHGLQRTKKDLTGRPQCNVDEQAVRDLVNVFRRLNMFVYTSHDRCLLDSLILANFLFQYGVPVTWVIGVATRPFSAHCWVQFHELVVNDALEHAKRFSPILVV